MEGLTDFYMRDMLTRMGHYDACVTEFVRVTERVLPARTFHQACPELRQGGKTSSGTPVHLQLLGSDPLLMGENAAFMASLGASHIDLNFGCPAKTVNKHRGGAVLLDEPETLYAIVQAVRRATPQGIPVTAKIRLGVKDRACLLDNVRAIEAAGANGLVVHARTKEEGYRPPAHWEAIAEIRNVVSLPVMANGEIWTKEDAHRCQSISGCTDLMLGRGAIADPSLVSQIRGEADEHVPLSWTELLQWQRQFLENMLAAKANPDEEHFGVVWTERGAIGRYKQWLGMLTQRWPEAIPLFANIKKLQHLNDVMQLLQD